MMMDNIFKSYSMPYYMLPSSPEGNSQSATISDKVQKLEVLAFFDTVTIK